MDVEKEVKDLIVAVTHVVKVIGVGLAIGIGIGLGIALVWFSNH